MFACPKCKNFTNAPVGQKRRRCSYCGHIIDISRAQCAHFDSPEAAQHAVKEFNASRGGDEFQRAVERSREKIRSLVPRERVSGAGLVEEGTRTLQTGKRRVLLNLLEQSASQKPCSLDEFAELCRRHNLDWSWVEEQLIKLSNQGVIIFPRPWSIRIVQTQSHSKAKKSASADITGEVRHFLHEHGGSAKVSDIISHFSDRGIAESLVDKALDKMMRSGEIYQPSASEVKLID